MRREKEPIVPLDPRPIKLAVEPLLAWYKANARDLPWRRTSDPYRIWLSEIMLQQTRVEAVIPYYRRFLDELPTIEALADVSDERLMKLWEGLGYYSRARNLKKAAQVCVERYQGRLPSTYGELLKLPGFGMYTAGAVASIAFGQRVPAVDGNVLRVVSRLCAYGEDIMLSAVRKAFFDRLLALMPEDAGAFNQALMDLGASVCIPNGLPCCKACPLNSICEAHLEGQELAFPLKRAKNARRIEEKTVLMIECDGEYLLHKRDANGLLASMWEFPNAEGELTEEEVRVYCRKLGSTAESVVKSIDAKHIFSHVEWHMKSYRITARNTPQMEAYKWVNREQMQTEIALPSAFSAFKKEIGGV